MEDFSKYRKETLVIDLLQANRFGLKLLVPIILLLGIPFFFIWRDEISFMESFRNMGFLKIIIALFGGIVLHEWSLFVLALQLLSCVGSLFERI